MVEDRFQGQHEIAMVNRQTLDVSGVINVESFDNEQFLLHTECGYLAIRGRNLHIKTLNLEQGKVAIEGTFFDVSYLDEGPNTVDKARGFFGRLFR